MSKIILPFSQQMQAAIKDGRKCCTSRTHKKGEAGDIFSIDGQLFRITHIIEMYADSVAKELYGAEGFNSPAGFIGWWTANKGKFDPVQVLQVHFFAAVLPVQSVGFVSAAKV
ncbi:hypothetical protein McpCs1_14380 [Methanocorpusculaceae archaeon Cs1]|uniref:ASCH domain-containing protein n=2 Tax=Methanorbis rubei TaxID=3028300 RepID=A0AAE4SCQ9_9EURY|nr:hypothetical protein [Methanocorpusculaceae archaeon Cs1]